MQSFQTIDRSRKEEAKRRHGNEPERNGKETDNNNVKIVNVKKRELCKRKQETLAHLQGGSVRRSTNDRSFPTSKRHEKDSSNSKPHVLLLSWAKNSESRKRFVGYAARLKVTRITRVVFPKFGPFSPPFFFFFLWFRNLPGAEQTCDDKRVFTISLVRKTYFASLRSLSKACRQLRRGGTISSSRSGPTDRPFHPTSTKERNVCLLDIWHRLNGISARDFSSLRERSVKL